MIRAFKSTFLLVPMLALSGSAFAQQSVNNADTIA